MVPTDFSEYPIFYTDEDRKWLEGSPFLRRIDDYATKIEADYNLIAENIPGFSSEHSLTEYKEMYLINESRQLSNEIFGLYNVPLFDLFNHNKVK